MARWIGQHERNPDLSGLSNVKGLTVIDFTRIFLHLWDSSLDRLNQRTRQGLDLLPEIGLLVRSSSSPLLVLAHKILKQNKKTLNKTLQPNLGPTDPWMPFPCLSERRKSVIFKVL